MIAYEKLNPIEGMRDIRFCELITLADMKKGLLQKSSEHGVLLLIRSERLVSDRFVKKRTMDCIVVRNARHPTDFFSYCIFITELGNFSFACIRRFGMSRLLEKNAEIWENEQTGQSLEKATIVNRHRTRTWEKRDAAMSGEIHYYALLTEIWSAFQKQK